MPTLIHAAGTEEELDGIPKGLKEMQALVGGLIQMVPFPDGGMVMCNEEGKLEDQPVNLTATKRWFEKLGHSIDDVLVGSVVFFTAEEVQEMD